MNKLKRSLKILILMATLWIIARLTYSTIDGRTDENLNADIALILGTTVNYDGTLSQRLEKRLQCGLELYQKKRVKKLLVSGGLGVEGHWEGDKMRDYLIKNGVPNDAIIVDNFGNNTIASVDNTLKLKDSLKFNSIIVVSQYFHLTRAKMFFRKRNFSNVSSVCPKYYEFRDLYSLLREFPAYYVGYLFN